MIIKKKSVTACDAVAAPVVDIEQPITSFPESNCINTEVAQQHIRSAIDALCLVAKDNEVARESIANLSVVLLDLKTNC